MAEARRPERRFTEEEIAHFHIGGLSKQTKSPRIRRMIKLAFILGQMRGVKDVYELSQPVYARAGFKLRESPE